ncbi:Mitochondrial distribution and morphology protein 12 [Mycoblastus sanguinarius]|nr:Mitochondrial distribution and morphology protein 12 [Mycoblastus sanguinarius]
MSIDIDWHHLTTGPEGLELASSIRDFIHDKFQQVQLPRFIRSVQVHSFDFGNEAPVVELKDISDPLAEFYEDEEGSEEDGEETRQGDRVDEVAEDTPPAAAALRQPGHGEIPPSANDVQKTAKPSSIDTRLPTNPRTGFGIHEQIATPFLSRSTTPGIPGGTSNFSYFHLPLSAGFSGTQAPLEAVRPFSQPSRHDHHYRPPSPLRQEHVPYPSCADPTSHPPPPHLQPFQTSQPPLDPHPREQDRSQDLQTTLHISYTGSLSLSLTAEILLDYPMPSFVGIPLKLHITGLSFDGVALLAYLRQPEKTKVHFCFLGREDAEAMVGKGSGADAASGSGSGSGGRGGRGPMERSDSIGVGENGDGLGMGDAQIQQPPQEGEGKLGGLLREIRVESEIGRQEDGKQVLKNVGKVEKFVLEQVRRIFEDEFVWPSFWTFLV